MKILYDLIIALWAIAAVVSLFVVAILISSAFHIDLLAAVLIVAFFAFKDFLRRELATMENKKLIKKLEKEQNKLDAKRWKLQIFIANQEDSQTISNYQLNLLIVQRDAMSKYSDILGMRINDLKEHHD